MMESAHTYMYTCLCMCMHRDRLGLKFCRCTGTWSPFLVSLALLTCLGWAGAWGGRQGQGPLGIQQSQ